jgi:3-methyl-2-oxobutanoate hydroxymethyltransferase
MFLNYEDLFIFMKIEDIKRMKGKEKISVLTCYDYSFAKIIDRKVDIILVGDSLGNVVLGYDKTKHVKMEDMIRHVEAVRRGAPNTFIVADLPYGSYDDKKGAVINARKLVKAGADAVKPEGKPEIVRMLVHNDIEVMGHIGHLPQSEVKAKVHREWNELLDSAKSLEEAGAFAVVLEMVQSEVAKKISKILSIPTIGIGAGKGCDGQVLVLYDLLGLYPDFEPKFARKYLNLKEGVSKAVKSYTKDVKAEKFPSKKEGFE